MTRTQTEFLANMTAAQARAVITKFDNNPQIADETSDAAYVAFCQAWEMLYPTEYWQRARMAGGTRYNLISLG